MKLQETATLAREKLEEHAKRGRDYATTHCLDYQECGCGLCSISAAFLAVLPIVEQAEVWRGKTGCAPRWYAVHESMKLAEAVDAFRSANPAPPLPQERAEGQ